MTNSSDERTFDLKLVIETYDPYEGQHVVSDYDIKAYASMEEAFRAAEAVLAIIKKRLVEDNLR